MDENEEILKTLDKVSITAGQNKVKMEQFLQIESQKSKNQTNTTHERQSKETNELSNYSLEQKMKLLSLLSNPQLQKKAITLVTSPNDLLPTVNLTKQIDVSKLKFFTKEILTKLEEPGYFIFDGFLASFDKQQNGIQSNSIYNKSKAIATEIEMMRPNA